MHPVSDRQTVSTEEVVESVGGGERNGVVLRLAGGLTGTAADLFGSVPGRVGALIEAGADRVAGGLGRAVEGLLGGSGKPFGGPPPEDVVPPAAPPPAPVSSACSPGGTSLSGGSGSCGGAAEKLFHQFAVLAPFAVVVPLPEIEVAFHSREALLPSVAPRPPNGRPG